MIVFYGNSPTAREFYSNQGCIKHKVFIFSQIFTFKLMAEYENKYKKYIGETKVFTKVMSIYEITGKCFKRILT